MSFWQQIAENISTATQIKLTQFNTQAIGGGCINAAYRLGSDGRDFFVKLNRAEHVDMFTAEMKGLQMLVATQTVRVPQTICHGVAADRAYLVLEYLPLQAMNSSAQTQLGDQLARLHAIEQPYFGWIQNNTLGTTAQYNTPSQNWLDFWREQRLGYQLKLAEQNGYSGKLQVQGKRLLDSLADLFADYSPRPALVHGDLWGGNAGMDHSDQPVIFDPACYFADRETDLAMMELFGGFSTECFAAYQKSYPLEDGYELRCDLYQLYHVLNHLNLFGGSYLAQSEHLLQRLSAAI